MGSGILQPQAATKERILPIVPGSRFGPYEILASLGSGGMGEVYRARDDRLERSVAIKVLGPHNTDDVEHRKRFQREAQALSRLNHPNVCAVYDVGAEGGRDYIVMELLEGETLAARLERGPIPLERTLGIAQQIAGALESAHRVGLVHRDLKPANVMLTPSGVKLVDFGLARFVQGGALPSLATASVGLTAVGSLLGTLQYMAPEQAEGREADARSDLFSFGAVLYEMVTGHRAFAGETQASVIAAILKDDPPSIVAAQPAAPPELDGLIRSCLAKHPADRWQSAHDLQLELVWLADRARRPTNIDPRVQPTLRSPFTWMALTILLASVTGLLIWREQRGRPGARPAIRASIPAPAETQFISVGTHAGPAVLSPDGRRLVFLALSQDGRLRLWVHFLDTLMTQPLVGTEGASHPFWSPDGEHVGFFADRKLRRVSIAGSTVTPLCDTGNGAGGTWNRDNIIVFAPALNTGLQRIPAAGGSPRAVSSLELARREWTHRWPTFLPDGRRFLFSAGQQDKTGRWVIRVGSLDSDQVHDVSEGQSNALYAGGALIFARDGTLLAQPVDDRLRATADPVGLAENVLHDTVLGRAVFSASERGTLVYQRGSAVAGSRLLWLDRAGKEVGVLGDTCFCIWPSISPDGSRAAVAVTDARTGNGDLWIYDLPAGRRQQLTFEEALEANPTWTPTGDRLIFTSTRRGVRDIHWKHSLGSGEQEPLLESDRNKTVQSVSSHGVVFVQDDDLWLLPLLGGKEQPLRVSEHRELFGHVSPDGRWLLYQTNESGKPEVFVTSFPGRVGKWRISESTGLLPKWSANGQEIFYLSWDHTTLYAVAVSEGPTLRVLNTSRLFSAPMVSGRGYPYEPTSDAKRFLVVTSLGATTTPLTLVVDWPSELKRQ